MSKSNVKHTPGPWSLLPARTLVNVKGVNGEQICQLPFGRQAYPTAAYDSYLIAAAPELLEALEKFSHDIEALKHSTDEADFPLELAEYSTTYLEPYLKQLIAKAKGEA